MRTLRTDEDVRKMVATDARVAAAALKAVATVVADAEWAAAIGSEMRMDPNVLAVAEETLRAATDVASTMHMEDAALLCHAVSTGKLAEKSPDTTSAFIAALQKRCEEWATLASRKAKETDAFVAPLLLKMEALGVRSESLLRAVLKRMGEAPYAFSSTEQVSLARLLRDGLGAEADAVVRVVVTNALVRMGRASTAPPPQSVALLLLLAREVGHMRAEETALMRLFVGNAGDKTPLDVRVLVRLLREVSGSAALPPREEREEDDHSALAVRVTDACLCALAGKNLSKASPRELVDVAVACLLYTSPSPRD